MSYGFKIFNWVEDAEKDFGRVRSFYKAKEVDDYIHNLKAENERLQKQYLQAVKAANENIAKNVDGNSNYWKELCEKRTKMYIEKLEVMKVALLREMATRAFYESEYIWYNCEGCSPTEVKSMLFRAKKRERQYHLFMKKAAKLEKELNEQRSKLG